ncbi:tRNA adenosine(34) deaminase TadA [Chitinibacter sp. ZOR0017]|uniref:tRNA adenosine(34) deaminase TadA n=1 Tax=Chitinibacter sp. ZOR0017 TaxID=1339254 RepID=UPI0018CEA20A|nr:tRNA adenosine(34) deaminase TadA [Chitinibacter sp. ZOR0017]
MVGLISRADRMAAHDKPTLTSPNPQADAAFMQAALAQAAQAAQQGEVPVGAVVVYRGVVIAAAHNQPLALNDPSAHAEMLALRAAAKQLGNYRLSECELFVTLEPCIMCAGAILHARVRRVVYATADAKTGAAGSVINPFASPQLNHHTCIQAGPGGAESAALLGEFFRQQRASQRATRARPQVAVPGLANLRDLGGLKTADGRQIRAGLLFRSEQLQAVDPDCAEFIALQIRSIWDLRSAAERAQAPNPHFRGVSDTHCDVLAATAQATACSVPQLLAQPAQLEALLGEVRAAAMMHDLYRELVANPAVQQVYAQWLTNLSLGGQYPALVHCTAGKDRTGWAMVLLLSALGVPHESILRDYLLSDAAIRGKYAPLIAQACAAGASSETLTAILGVQAAYLKTAMHEVKKQAGNMPRYLREVLGLSSATIAALQAQLLQPADR